MSLKEERQQILDQLQWYKQNQTISTNDAKTVVRRGKEISQLRQEMATLHQRLEAALSKRSQKEKLSLNVETDTTTVLKERVKQLEFELKDRDECIDKMMRIEAHRKKSRIEEPMEIEKIAQVLSSQPSAPVENGRLETEFQRLREQLSFVQKELADSHYSMKSCQI